MDSTTTVGATGRPSNPTNLTTGSTNQGGFGKYLLAAVILVAVFFATKALVPTESTVAPAASDVPAAVAPVVVAPAVIDDTPVIDTNVPK